MGTRIEAVVALAGHGIRRPTALHLADTAARDCLTRAGRKATEVDLLINAGVYREDNMGEPALAALVQEDIGANLGDPPVGGHGTFSFDLMNGVCGVVSAVQIEAGLLSSRAIQLGLIVTSDVDPNPKDSGSTLVRPTGGAMLLGWDEGIAGFTDFSFETFPEYEHLLVSGLSWRTRRGPRAAPGPAGHSMMDIREQPGYLERCADCADEAARRFLSRLGMGIGDIDLLVAAPAAPAYFDRLRERLGVTGDRTAFVGEDLAGSYTAGPLAALDAAMRSGKYADATNTLVVATGAGITVALALYRQSPPEDRGEGPGPSALTAR